jgi:hypothetical protein
VRGDPREDLLLSLEVAEHGVTEDRLAIAGLSARLRSRLGPGSSEVHQLTWLPNGQRPQERLLEERENGGIGADSQRERDDRNQGHERRLGEPPEGELQVVHGLLDEKKGPKVGPDFVL